MKIFLSIIFISINFIWASDIQSDVEEILKSEFVSNIELSLHKYELPSELKLQAENKVQQKFFNSFVYIWKICREDSLWGYAILDNTNGKSLPITFLVIFSPTGKIRRVDIIRYRESYGGAIGSRPWLNQFIGKSSREAFRVERDIDTISGATISVNSVTRAVYKLTVIVEQLVVKESFTCSEEHQPVESKAK